MEIKIKIISQETIKPSSPTPKSLQKYQLSFLDQIAPPIFIPLVYFYPSHDNLSISEKSNHLKKSLSETLSRFYPLAGRLVSDLYIDCNDAGSPFFEAEANCDLSDIITNPNPRNMNKLLPYRLDDVQNIGMAVQITRFQCDGIAIGLVMSHKIADVSSFFLFVNTWATVARNGNEGEVPSPKFEAASIFPPRDVAGFKPSVGTVVKDDEHVAKIFTFPATKIADLRERYLGELPQRQPSRVEALSAFIWTRFISITEMKPDPNKIHTVLHAVNLRSRFEPPLSEYHFGNKIGMAIARQAVRDGRVIDSGYEFLQKVREAIRAVDGEYVARLKEGYSHLNFMKEIIAQLSRDELVTFNFSSWCRFPLYGADFGWGKPVWVGSASWMCKNLVIFIDSATGDGIEAWISLKKEDMEKLEADLELQEFTSKAKNFGSKNSEFVASGLSC